MEAAIRERVKQWMEKRVADKDEDADNAEAAKPEDMEVAFEEITELILDGRPFKTVGDADAALLKKLKNLTKLACNQTGLTNVSNFPCMLTVKSLELTDNHISGGLEELVKAFPNLKRLQLGGNHLKNFADIEPLKELEHLEQLGLDMSPLSSEDSYREKIFEMLPQLVILDSQDKEGREVDAVGSDDDEEEEEDDEQEAADTTLRDFYEKDLDEEDDEDEEDFQPEGDEEDDDDDDEELDEEGDGEEESAGEEEEEGDEETANEESKATEEEEEEQQQQQQQQGRKRKGSSAEQLENGGSAADEESSNAAKQARLE